MNDAHLHLVVNHFPIIGMIFGVGILIAGILLKNNLIKNVAYILFVIAAIFGAISMSTGEGAEEIAEKLPSVTDQIIEEHEEMAEKFILLLYATALLSIVSLFLGFKKIKFQKTSSIITLIVAVGAVILAKQTGTTGGEIRHTEIRENYSENVNSATKQVRDKDDD